MNRTHLADDRLIELCLSGAGATGGEPHLARCATCSARHAALALMLDEIDAAGAAEADEVFPADRLARQQARILQRLEQAGRPGRVLAFPASRTHQPSVLHQLRPTTRWVAAAGVAGLVVGLLAGHLARDYAVERGREPASQVSQVPPPIGSLGSTSISSDDEFLGQIQVAVERAGPAMLRPLDALTPTAWDVR
jgi:hypothetical protein